MYFVFYKRLFCEEFCKKYLSAVLKMSEFRSRLIAVKNKLFGARMRFTKRNQCSSNAKQEKKYMSIINLTLDDFEKEVILADRPVLVDFWAPWCVPCRIMSPTIENFAKEFEGKYIVGKVNVDSEEKLAVRYNIMSIPALKVFKNGEVVASAVGVQSREKLLALLER